MLGFRFLLFLFFALIHSGVTEILESQSFSSFFMKKKIALKEQAYSDIKWGNGIGRCLSPFLSNWNLRLDNIRIYKNIKHKTDTLCRLLSKKKVPKEDISCHELGKDFPNWEWAQHFWSQSMKLCNCFSVGYQWVKELQKFPVRMIVWVRSRPFTVSLTLVKNECLIYK